MGLLTLFGQVIATLSGAAAAALVVGTGGLGVFLDSLRRQRVKKLPEASRRRHIFRALPLGLLGAGVSAFALRIAPGGVGPGVASPFFFEVLSAAWVLALGACSFEVGALAQLAMSGKALVTGDPMHTLPAAKVRRGDPQKAVRALRDMKRALRSLEEMQGEIQGKIDHSKDAEITRAFSQSLASVNEKVGTAKGLLDQAERMVMGWVVRRHLDEALKGRPDESLRALAQSGADPSMAAVKKVRQGVVAYLQALGGIVQAVNAEAEAADGSVAKVENISQRQPAHAAVETLDEVVAAYQRTVDRLDVLMIKLRAEVHATEAVAAAERVPQLEKADGQATAETASAIANSESGTRNLMEQVKDESDRLAGAMAKLQVTPAEDEELRLAELLRTLREL